MFSLSIHFLFPGPGLLQVSGKGWQVELEVAPARRPSNGGRLRRLRQIRVLLFSDKNIVKVSLDGSEKGGSA